jgi:hypothetical protein
MRFQRIALLVCGLACVPVPGASGAARAQGVDTASVQRVDGRYTVTLAGFRLGRATLNVAFEPQTYLVQLSAKLTGLVGAVTHGQGSASARGTLSAPPLSNGFSLLAEVGGKPRKIEIAATFGNVRSVTIEPALDPAPDRVALKPEHRIAIIDPLAAFILPVDVANPLDPANCARKIPVFDGTQRFDVVLAFKESRELTHDSGYRGGSLICSARYVPLGGHRPERRVTQYMMENRDIEVWLVPVQGGRALLPLRIGIKTLLGTAIAEADRLSGLQ